MKKVFALMLSLLLLASMLPAMAESDLVDDESVHYTFTVMQGKQFDVPEQNETVKFLEEKFNCTLEFMLVSRGSNDYQNKCNLLIAQNEIPDLIQLNDYSILTNMVELGLLYPLDELVEEYGQEMKAIRPQECWDPFIFDGVLYSLPNQYRTDGIINEVREDWLKNLNKEIPTTIEEYEEILRAFTEDDPDGNGVKDTYGLCGPNSPITSAFLPAYQYYGILPDQWFVGEDGKLTYGSIQPEMLNALKLINKWFLAGYIDPQFPLYSREKYEEILGQGKFGCTSSTEVQRLDPAFDIGLAALKEIEPDSHWIAHAPILSKDGKQRLWTNDFRSIGYTMAISANCENPVRLMKLINYCASEEGYLRIRYGEEGVQYTVDETGTFHFTPEWADINVRTQAGLSIQYSNIFRREWFDRCASAEVWDGVRMFEEYGSPISPIFVTTDADTEYKATLDTMRDEAFTKMICAEDPSTLDKMFEDFCKNWLNNGGQEVIDAKNAAYAESL